MAPTVSGGARGAVRPEAVVRLAPASPRGRNWSNAAPARRESAAYLCVPPRAPRAPRRAPRGAEARNLRLSATSWLPDTSRPFPRTDRTRLVPHPVLSGHVSSLTPYCRDTSDLSRAARSPRGSRPPVDQAYVPVRVTGASDRRASPHAATGETGQTLPQAFDQRRVADPARPRPRAVPPRSCAAPARPRRSSATSRRRSRAEWGCRSRAGATVSSPYRVQAPVGHAVGGRGGGGGSSDHTAHGSPL